MQIEMKRHRNQHIVAYDTSGGICDTVLLPDSICTSNKYLKSFDLYLLTI